MKYLILLLSLSLAAFASGNSEPENLFNGRDLTGWTIHGTEKWYVDHGELVCESGPDKGYGYLSTNKNYRNFELTLEFKQEANGNSGVFIRSGIEGTKISGWQVEVAPKGNNTGGIYESYGRGWLAKPDTGKEEPLKVGDWNTLRIVVKDDRVITWLNGTRMVDLQDEKVGTGDGFVALQIHDGGGIKVRWRNIRINEYQQ
ncbi:MAG TPA: DUF1080 domain-containing protein [Sphingobacteriaceae bacterium]